MTVPLVTICLPTYRRLDLLERALKSCLAQTFPDFEIVVSDDDPEQSARGLVERLNHVSIRYVVNTRARGWVGNTNYALSCARGRYIKFLHDDDLLKPRCLERMVAVLETHPEVGVVSAPLEIIDEGDHPASPRFYLVRRVSQLYRYAWKDQVLPRAGVMRDFLTHYYPCCAPSGLMFRAEGFEKLGAFDPEAGAILDLEMCLRFSLEYNFYFIAEPLACWRCSMGSDTVIKQKNGQDLTRFYYLVRKYLQEIETRGLLSSSDLAALRPAAFRFASKRCALNVISAWQSGNFCLAVEAWKTLRREDPYPGHAWSVPVALVGEWIRFIASTVYHRSPHHQLP
jgi:glycosyltransferase involved in cell wall biosynthesis